MALMHVVDPKVVYSTYRKKSINSTSTTTSDSTNNSGMSGDSSDVPEAVELPVWLGGCQKWVTGLTKRTTCDDVIYALLAHDANPNAVIDVSNYAVYERWRGVERPLRGRTKVLKVWRAWGTDRNSVRFSVRKTFEPMDIGYENYKPSSSRRHRRQQNSSTTRHKETKSSRHAEKQRSRSQDHRNRAEDQSRQRGHHSSTSTDKHKKRMFHDMVKVVLDQEKRIQDQVSRLRDTDSQIENYETKMHVLRMKQNGQNYVQEAYLRDRSEDSSSGGEELFPAIKANDLEAYMHICDNILDMEAKIEKENAQITRLQEELDEHSRSSLTRVEDSFFDVSDVADANQSANAEENLQQEIEYLRQELERCMALSTAQEKQCELVDKTLLECDIEMQRKLAYIQTLEYDLSRDDDVHDESPACDDTEQCRTTIHNVNDTPKPVLPPRAPTKTVHFDPNATLILDSRVFDSGEMSSPDSGVDHGTDEDPPSPPIYPPRLQKFYQQNPSSKFAHHEMPIDVNGLDNSEVVPSALQTNLPEYPERAFFNSRTLEKVPEDAVSHAYKVNHLPVNSSSPEAYYHHNVPAHTNYQSHLVKTIGSDNDSNSDTGLSSLHSDDSQHILETLV